MSLFTLANWLSSVNVMMVSLPHWIPNTLLSSEMVEYTKQFSRASDNELNTDERNILSVAFKNVVGTRRAAWRVLSSIQKKENNKGNAENVNKVKVYKQSIEKELTDIC